LKYKAKAALQGPGKYRVINFRKGLAEALSHHWPASGQHQIGNFGMMHCQIALSFETSPNFFVTR
jgi:hypothetical protein